MTKTSLYDIAESLRAILEYGDCDEESGVPIGEQIAALKMTYDDKVDGVIAFIKEQRALATAIKAEQDALKERRAAIENRVERLSEYLANCLRIANKTAYENARHKVTFRRSEAIEIIDESLIPAEFKVVKTTETVDKKAIKEAIEEGEIVDGAVLVERQNIQIR